MYSFDSDFRAFRDSLDDAGFEVIRQLGMGGFGAVHLVRECSSGKLFAAKWPSSAQVEASVLRAMFIREALRCLGLKPTAVSLDGSGTLAARWYAHIAIADQQLFFDEPDRTPILLMEFIDGRSLQHYLHDDAGRPTPLEWQEAVLIGVQICRGMLYCRSRMREFVHKDLKPGNVMLQRTSASVHAKVIDFGIARNIGMGSGVTRVGEAFARAYVPPEVRQFGEETDVFATALTIHEMLAGIHLSTLGVSRVPLMSIPGVPRDLAELVESCHASEPSRRRITTFLELHEALQRFLVADLPPAPAPQPLPPASPSPVCRGYVSIAAGGFASGYHPTTERAALLNDLHARFRNFPSLAEIETRFPARSVELRRFDIKRTPVTNREYREFVEATGHRPPEYWTDPRTGVPEERLDWPVVQVSFADAQAYCEWRGTRLPTALEWEKAARGGDGRLYPWGDRFVADACNCSESGVGHPSAVEDFEDYASPSGVVDCAGNVAEWVDGGVVETDRRRVAHLWRSVRGGSFRHAGAPANITFFDGTERFCDTIVHDPSGRAAPLAPLSRDWIGFRDVHDVDPVTPRQELVLIEGGRFLGGPGGAPQDCADFRMARFAVSNEEYLDFVLATGHRRPPHWNTGARAFLPRQRDLPVVNVSHEDALKFCEWKSRMTGIKHKLPSKVQWERAVRGRVGDPREGSFPWGEGYEAYRCNSAESGYGRLLPVHALPEGCSSEGIYQLCGNVFEWLLQKPETRGGSWRFQTSCERVGRAWAKVDNPNEYDDETGFRYCTGAGGGGGR